MSSNPNKANKSQIESTPDEIKVNDYCYLLQDDKSGFSANDLVWGKIKSNPWWPGQIFDPKYSSEMSLKCQKKDHFLVAYFGDKTFAWVPESQPKPFQSCFSEMEKQSSTDSFTNAVGAVLEEVSKRVELGLACHCSADGSYDKLLEYRKVENAGIRVGTCSVVDKLTVANAFQPESLLEYVWALARCPSRGFVRLELTVAAAQLKSFYRSKGHSQLPIFVSHIGLVENESEISHLKCTRPRGRPRKNHINEDGSEQKSPSNKMEEEVDADYLADGDKSRHKVKSVARACGKKQRDADPDSADLGRSKKDGVGKEVDLKTKTRSSIHTRTRSVNLDDHISQAASQLKEKSPLILNSIDDTPQNSVNKRSRRKGADHLSKAEKENEVATKEHSSPSEKLSQLYLVARDPMKGYNFLPLIKGFFTDFRVSYFSNSSEDQEPIKSTGRKRGRKEKVVKCEPASLEMSDPDFRFSPTSNSSDDQEPVKSTGRKRGRKKKVMQEPIKSTGRKRGRQKKVKCEPASLEMSDPDFRFSPSSNSSDDQEPVKSTGRKRGRKKKVVQEPIKSTGRKRGRKKKVKCEPASLEMSDPDFRFSPSSNSSDDQEPVKSTGRKRGRKKKLVNCEPTSIEMSDPDFSFSPSSNSSEDQEPVKSMGIKRGRKQKMVNSEPDYIQDSYWSDSPEREPVSEGQKRKGGSQKKGQMKKKKPAGESMLYDPKAPCMDTEQNNLLVGFSNPYEKQEVKEDSYWSDIILQSSPEREPASKGKKRKGGSQKKGQTKKTKPTGESVLYDPKAPSMDTEQNNLLVGFSKPHEKQEVKEERIVEETPTALILSFNDYDSLPSAADLIKIFSSYGSLKEEETEVLRKTNRAKVVFKYRHDAENAFSTAGQSGDFGPALVSYRLRYSPSPKSSPASSPQDMNDAPPTNGGNLGHQDCNTISFGSRRHWSFN